MGYKLREIVTESKFSQELTLDAMGAVLRQIAKGLRYI